MKDTLAAHYPKLNPTERLALAIQAQARGDEAETIRLRDTCPKVQYVAQIDLAYVRKADVLQTLALVHSTRFFYLAMQYFSALNVGNYQRSTERLKAFKSCVESWSTFCDEIGQDPDQVQNVSGAGDIVRLSLECFDDFCGVEANTELFDAYLADYRAGWQH